MNDEEIVRHIRTALNLPLKRPEHPDMERLGEILRRFDDKWPTPENPVFDEPFKAEVATVIDRATLTYVARERAYRVIMLMEAMGGMPRGFGPGELRVKSMCMDFLAGCWIDAAVMMATFERERPKDDA